MSALPVGLFEQHGTLQRLNRSMLESLYKHIVNGSDGHVSNDHTMRDMFQPPTHLLAICTILYIAIFILGLVGNIAVILVVLQYRSMRTSINLLFLNLCLADLFALLITGPTVVVDIFAKEAWYLGAFMLSGGFHV
ncbi:somatostatin-like receptor F_48D10.1 [Biomphalaria glabrata]|uniref:Somatostatin-like receptor F_48D10.1 n=1 Tax=Biomphalaria glabrata TaxID=6526 RepID=A0A9W3AXI2_BIOGL|nr:somatostatin-like receptor F_48D10.1 [Biomphalaria glabrata]